MSKQTGYAIRRGVESTQLVAVEPTTGHSWRLQAHRTIPVDTDWPADLARELGRCGGRYAWLLPEEDVTSTQTPLPRLKRGEMERAVTGWVARQEGGDPDDWVVSWRTFDTGKAATDNQQVAMVYTDRQDLSWQLSAASAHGAAPGLMLPPSLVLDQFFRAAAPESASLDVWNLVFVGGRTNVLCVANRDGLLLTRPLPGDLSGGENREEYVQRLATEVDRSIFFARQTAGSPEVDGVFVCGDPQLANDLVGVMRTSTSVTCQHWPLTDAIDCGDLRPDSDQQLLLMAAALAPRRVHFNLASMSRRGPLNEQTRRRLLVGAAAAAVALVPILTIGGIVTSRIQRDFLAEAEERFAAATIRAEEAATIYDRQRLLQARERFIAEHVAARCDLENLLLRLAAATPPTVLYRDLQIIDGTGGLILNLSGESVAASLGEAQQAFMTFQAAIADMNDLQAIGEPRELQVAELDDDGRIRQTVRFNLRCRLVTPAGGQEG